jgi:L-threonylcarbamoyladenylate synthase
MSNDIIARAVEILGAGGVVALPTETVYGLAADAANDTAVRRVYAIKGRPADHPLIVHVPNAAQLPRYAAGDRTALNQLAERFWPGPLTAIVIKAEAVSDIVTAGQRTVALRIIDHPLTQAILERFGRAVAAPSANRFGRVSPTTAQHVRDDLGAEVDFVVDGGPARVGVESTIVDLTGAVPAILRAGVIGPTELGAALGVAVVTRIGGPVRAPGTLAAHYAPRARVILVTAQELAAQAARLAAAGQRVGLLTLPSAPHAAARELYATLRALDADGYDVVLTVLPPEGEANAAVRDRLTRAAAGAAQRALADPELCDEQQPGGEEQRAHEHANRKRQHPGQQDIS